MYCLSKIITISFTIASFSSYGWANPNNNLTQINTKTQAGSSSPLPDYDPSDALVVVMTNTFSGKRTGYGSVIGDGSLVVTAYHIAFESSELCLHTMPGIVTVISPYLGDLCNGRIIAADQELDVAVLEIPWRGHPSLELAPNEKLHKLDYGEFVSYMGGAATTETPPWGELITEKLPVKSVSCRRGIPIQIVLEGYGQLQDGWSGCPIISEKLLVGCFTTKFSVEPKIKLNVMPDESFYNSRRQDNAYGPAAGLIRKLIVDADKVENLRPSKTVMKQPKETQKATNHLLRAFSISAGDKISQEVIDQVEQFLNLRPKSALGTAYLAVCQEKAQKPDTETTYQRAIEYDKTNFYTRATYGQFLMNSGRMNGAREQFLQAKQLDPDTRMMDTMLVQILGSSGKSEEALAEELQKVFSTNWLRIYTNSDILGVELAGATKNVIAIAAGIIDGLMLGDNAKAALVTRGLVEISRLGAAMGAQPETFSGLSGVGDLITTCISPKGRNRTLGQAIGRGKTCKEAQRAIAGEVEGVNTCRSVVKLSQQYKVEMPITQSVYQILFEGKSVGQAIGELMTRRLKAETIS